MATTEKIKEFTVTEVKTTYKPAFKVTERPRILTPKDLHYYMMQYEPMNDIISYKEIFAVIYVNQNNNILSIQKIGEGGLTATSVDIRIIMQSALLQCATGLFLVHNHPSGQLKPSQADKALTQQTKQAAEFFNIQVLDHVIITESDYYSMFEENQL